MPDDVLATIGLAAWVAVTLWLANLVHFETSNFIWSRKLAHGMVGLGLLGVPFMFSTTLWPALLAFGMAAMFALLILRHGQKMFHGVAQQGRYSEFWFAFSCGVCLLSGLWFNPWIGVTCALMLAWGDGITGLVRYWHCKKHVKGFCGTLACYLVCMAIGFGLLHSVLPYGLIWFGVAVATSAESFCGDVGIIKKVDDNLGMPMAALATYLIGAMVL